MCREYLEDLQSRIDPEAEERLWDEWEAFCDGKFGGEIFSPKRSYIAPSSVSWPELSVNESFRSYEKMMVHQLAACSKKLCSESGSLLCVRANYGVGILSSVFGASISLMEESLNTLPTSVPLGSTAKIRQIVAEGVPDLTRGLGAKVLECGRFMKETFAAYPAVSRYVHVYHPDLQGPLDVCELLWGSEIFTAMYLEPQLFTDLLGLVTETYIRFMGKWFEIFPPEGRFSVHWGWMQKGAVMLRNDSAMNFSGDTYDELIRQYDQRILSECGGGAVHFCGRGDHYIRTMSAMEDLYGIQLSQPHLNDMDVILDSTVDKGIALIALHPDAANAAASRRSLRGRVHSAVWG